MCSFKERGEMVFLNNVAWLPIQNGLFGVEFLYTLAPTAAVAKLCAFLEVMPWLCRILCIVVNLPLGV